MTNRYLPTPLRRALERAAKDARITAEDGARDAIRRLGVAEGKAPGYLTDAEKDLRRRLRAHARTLGDAFDRTDETQETKRLVEGAAYAHWHRMLFARFLAERGLLRHPEHDVPVSLEDCRELAETEGLTDTWAVAERYAAAMLPAVFRMDDPVLAIDLDPMHTQKLHRLVTGLDSEVFQAEDSLGWTYQFWRVAEKQAINDSGVKIGADELSAVTQLFTEPYMVRFLLHNTLGAWWAGKVLGSNPALAHSSVNEDALRAACSLPEYSFDLLRFVREVEDGPWRPAAGTFPGWPTEAKDITMLDPCCGSGHFLTEGLAILTALRQVEERLSSSDAVAAVLHDNLYGLEIDGRCVQIAAFAVALSAWRIGGWQALPLPHIAWVGAPPPLPVAEFVSLADGDADMRAGLTALHELFSQAPFLGSLIEPKGGDLGDKWRLGNLESLLNKLLERTKPFEPETAEGAVAARGMADAAAILSQQFQLVATNVPFLGRAKQVDQLGAYIDRFYSESKSDLSTVMLHRMTGLLSNGGAVAAVTPQVWLFLSTYHPIRKLFLSRYRLSFLADLGPAAFRDMNWWAARTALICMTNDRPDRNALHAAFDADTGRELELKPSRLSSESPKIIEQFQQLRNPQSVISVRKIDTGTLLQDYVNVYEGMSTGDNEKYRLNFWEVSDLHPRWEYFTSTNLTESHYGGRQYVIRWEGGRGSLASEPGARIQGINAWRKDGFLISVTGQIRAQIKSQCPHEKTTVAIIPKKTEHSSAIYNFLRSEEYVAAVRAINQKTAVATGVLDKVVFDVEKWASVARHDNVEAPKEPYSNEPPQWLFHGHPKDADVGTAIHVAVARLCGYRWPAQSDSNIRLSAQALAWVSRAAELPAGDNDGLVGVPPVAGEKSLADRLRAYLAAAFGTDWSDALERRLVAEADEVLDKKVARDGSLEAWVRDRAFRQHCTLFGQRPFLWHISDGLKDGFSVFVHYHRFDQANLRKLTYTMLGDWLARAKAENNLLRYEKGRALQQTLEKVLEGEAPYDTFVRWKSLAQQPLGWDPDLDDGVRQNIRPFVKAGILTHDLTKILKDKDRGTDMASAPWYHVFKGERINDHHTTIAAKQAARDAVQKRLEAK